MKKIVRFGQDDRYLAIVNKVYGYKRAGGTIKVNGKTSYFPLMIKGTGLISVPFFEYGGIVADDWTKSEIISTCRQILDKTKTDYIEIHGGGEKERLFFVEKKMYQTAIKELPRKLDQLWNSITYQAQKTVTQARKFKVTAKIASTIDLKDVFYPMYVKWMKSFGSPIHPLKYFYLLQKYYGNDFCLVITQKDNLPLACLLGIRKDKVLNLLSSPCLEMAKKLRANDLAHYYLMTWAVKHKIKYFDFGPVRYEGQRHYKEKWGVELKPYSYWYFSNDKNFKIPPHLDPDVWYFRWLRFIWKNLVPEYLANWIGPTIRKYLMI